MPIEKQLVGRQGRGRTPPWPLTSVGPAIPGGEGSAATLLHLLARQFAGLLDPIHELRLVEFVRLIDVEITNIRLF